MMNEFFTKMENARNLLEEELKNRQPQQNCCGFKECAVTIGIKSCSKCKLRKYCCREHQTSDWTEHKKFCRPPLPEDPFQQVPLSGAKTTDLKKSQDKHEAAQVAAELLVCYFNDDVYPEIDVQLLFGIEQQNNKDHQYVGIDYPTGSIMYMVWKFIHRCYRERQCHLAVDLPTDDDENDRTEDIRDCILDADLLFITETKSAILAGRLPMFFVQEACGPSNLDFLPMYILRN